MMILFPPGAQVCDPVGSVRCRFAAPHFRQPLSQRYTGYIPAPGSTPVTASRPGTWRQPGRPAAGAASVRPGPRPGAFTGRPSQAYARF